MRPIWLFAFVVAFGISYSAFADTKPTVQFGSDQTSIANLKTIEIPKLDTARGAGAPSPIAMPSGFCLWGIECKPRGAGTGPAVMLVIAPNELLTMKSSDGKVLLESAKLKTPIAVGKVDPELALLILTRYAALADAARDPKKFVFAYVGEQINLANMIGKPKSEVVDAVMKCSALALNIAADAIEAPAYPVPAVGQALAVINYLSTLKSINDCASSVTMLAGKVFDYADTYRVKEAARQKSIADSIAAIRAKLGDKEAEAARRSFEATRPDALERITTTIQYATPPAGGTLGNAGAPSGDGPVDDRGVTLIFRGSESRNGFGTYTVTPGVDLRFYVPATEGPKIKVLP